MNIGDVIERLAIMTEQDQQLELSKLFVQQDDGSLKEVKQVELIKVGNFGEKVVLS